VYEGGWLHGKRDGEGEMKYESKDYFLGTYKADKRHGVGKMIYKDGGMYEGGYVGGKRDGQGRIQYGTGDVYEGGWRAGLRVGRGVYKKTSGEVYSGQYLLNKRHGQGKLFYPNSDHYDGETETVGGGTNIYYLLSCTHITSHQTCTCLHILLAKPSFYTHYHVASTLLYLAITDCRGVG
jgi:hypothetical protein